MQDRLSDHLRSHYTPGTDQKFASPRDGGGVGYLSRPRGGGDSRAWSRRVLYDPQEPNETFFYTFSPGNSHFRFPREKLSSALHLNSGRGRALFSEILPATFRVAESLRLTLETAHPGRILNDSSADQVNSSNSRGLIIDYSSAPTFIRVINNGRVLLGAPRPAEYSVGKFRDAESDSE